ncbi:nitroreductase family deazaflavin-dependent oxidoreductase [Georgenia sp. MJ206]|uniref:nitroreductase family deazaflavin-dependent oxidoreductase n=1 Tax=Georgenia wangjunii TaxID=3117730 RepID=UPI002F266B1C
MTGADAHMTAAGWKAAEPGGDRPEGGRGAVKPEPRQTGSPAGGRPVRRIPRRLARAPIWFYRLGLGGLLGPRLVMVEHRGRTSGRVRQVVLEVIERDGDEVYVPSGYGWSAQWLRNIEADPRVRLWSGWGSTGALARVLDPDAGRAVLEDYRLRHPRTARALARSLGIEAVSPDSPVPDDVGARIPVVRITPRPTAARRGWAGR